MTLSEITRGLEAAVAAVDVTRAAKEEAAKKAALTASDYEASLTQVRELNTQYTEFMKNILTNFGQVHG